MRRLPKESAYGPVPVVPEDRFWAKVQKTPGCWTWTGTTSRGYGNLRVGSSVDGTRRKVLAHRFSYELHHGHPPPKGVLMHTCDNPLCVNPHHLVPGTSADNTRDAQRKGRLRGVHAHVPRDAKGRWVRASKP